MGVKYTVELTREEAINRYVDLRSELMKEKLKKLALECCDTFLEDHIMYMNDELNNGEGFENYSIIGE